MKNKKPKIVLLSFPHPHVLVCVKKKKNPPWWTILTIIEYNKISKKKKKLMPNISFQTQIKKVWSNWSSKLEKFTFVSDKLTLIKQFQQGSNKI